MIRLETIRARLGAQQFEFSAEVPDGALAALIGPSGGGKTTLLNLIAGFLAAESGRILIDGRDVTGLAPAARPVTSVFQEHNLFAHLDAAANAGLGLKADLRLDAAARAKVSEALARVGLKGKEARLPGELSGGERQRVALARALLRRRPVLLLDEPFGALGPALRRDMLHLVDDLRRAHGLTVLMVSHDPADARAAATHASFISGGRMSPVIPAAAFFGAAAPAGLADYLGA